MYVSMYVKVYVCMYACMYVSIYIYASYMHYYYIICIYLNAVLLYNICYMMLYVDICIYCYFCSGLS
jgi:hypothetical protein